MPAPSWPMTIGRRAVPLPVADVQVGVAHARGEHADADLAGAWLDQLELADHGRLADRLEDRGTDRRSPPSRLGSAGAARRRWPGVYGT